MKKRLSLFAGAAVLTVLALCVFTGSCASTTLPPRLSPSQKALVRDLRFPARVGVERFKYPVYSDELAKALRATHLFAEVRALSAFPTPPDLIARIERPIYGTAVIPVWTGLSLGLVPTTFQEEHGFSFSLASGALQSQDRLRVEFSYSGPSTLGWYAVVLNLSPNRARGDVTQHERFRDGLAWALAQQRVQIFGLLGKVNGRAPR